MFLDLPDSVAEPREMVEAAEKIGLDVLCVTDHNSIRGAVEAKKHARSVEIVVGEEILTSEGEVLGLFLTEQIASGLTAGETIEVGTRRLIRIIALVQVDLPRALRVPQRRPIGANGAHLHDVALAAPAFGEHADPACGLFQQRLDLMVE